LFPSTLRPFAHYQGRRAARGATRRRVLRAIRARLLDAAAAARSFAPFDADMAAPPPFAEIPIFTRSPILRQPLQISS
jgi:hypothetical protein